MFQQEFWGMMSIFGVLWSSGMGGLGGAGAIVPIAIGFFMMDAKNAISLSNASIFLSALFRFFLNARKPHPLKNGKGILVDMNIAVLMLPAIISGV